jgi:nitrite reductase/ring-hydroxylating ferredoxin subunit
VNRSECTLSLAEFDAIHKSCRTPVATSNGLLFTYRAVTADFSLQRLSGKGNCGKHTDVRYAARKWFLAGGAIALIVGALALYTARDACTEVTGAESVSVPLALLARGRAHLFCYRDATGERIRFILAQDGTGRIHSVMDACAQCGRYHQGYRTDKDEVVCRFCGNRYRIGEMEKGRASCVPLQLPNTQSHGMIQLKVADLEKGRGQF